jgi:hypothetical protein
MSEASGVKCLNPVYQLNTYLSHGFHRESLCEVFAHKRANIHSQAVHHNKKARFGVLLL